MTNNGTLDTRLSQNLIHTYRIPCNVEYTKLRPFKIGGGNGIYIAHRPSGVKVWYATENNFESRKRLDSENRGTQYAEIGKEGLTKLYDNFYIYTEGTSADDKLEIEVTSAESSITPLLGNASGRIDEVESLGGLTQNAINDISRAVVGGLCPKCNNTFKLQVPIIGNFNFASNFNAQGMRLYHFPLGDRKISEFKFKNDTLYRIRQIGHFDIGQSRMEGDGTDLWRYKTADRIVFGYPYYNYFACSHTDDWWGNYPMKISFEGLNTNNPRLKIGGGMAWVRNDRVGYNGYTFCGKKDILDNLVNRQKKELDPTPQDIIKTMIGVDIKEAARGKLYTVHGIQPTDSNFNRFLEENFIEIPFSNIVDKDSVNEILDNCNPFSLWYRNFGSNSNCQQKRGQILEFTPIFAVTKDTASARTESYYDIWISSHLSLIKEIDSPTYREKNNFISSEFSNLYACDVQPYYQKFDLWGQKVRHSNNNGVVINYEGSGKDINSFDLVVSGETLNQYDKLMLGFNVSNLYNPALKLTKSTANCHSSIILEINEL